MVAVASVSTHDAGRGSAKGLTSGERAQAKLLSALAAPGGGAPATVVPIETAGAALRKAAIFDSAGARIGRIENFQIDFVRPGEGETLSQLRAQSDAGRLPRGANLAPQQRFVAHSDPRIHYSGPTIDIGDPAILVLEDPDVVASFESRGEVEVLLFTHPWSGEVELRFGGRREVLDLYTQDHRIPRAVKLDLGPEPQRVEIQTTGRKNPLAAGNQCLFGGFREMTGLMTPLRHLKQPRVRGAEFTSEFHRLLDSVPQEGLLLDVGGGGRQMDDSRYINLDYADYEEPDLVADATVLPLATGSIDAVYSTGVFEHIAEHDLAAAEVARVLKPGGVAIIGWAFMQPIHAEGQHFYNATPWGVERAFRALKLKQMWYDTSFAFLVRWGASVSGLQGHVPQEEIDAVCKTLHRWDSLIPATHKQYMANGVWAEFVKA